MSEEIYQPPQPQEASRHSRLREALAATAVVASLLPGVAHERHTEVTNIPTVEVSTDTVTQVIPGEPIQKSIDIRDNVSNKYQADFETDHQDAESSLEQVDALLEQELGSDGWQKVSKIEVVGMASAEDEKADGGEQTPSVPNADLALQRGKLSGAAVLEAFKKRGINADKIIEVSGREDTWSDEEMQNGQALAEQFGYSTVDEMVDYYNNEPGSTPDAVNEFLKPLLDARRGAHITVTMKDSEGHERTVQIPVVRVERGSEQVKKVTDTKRISSIQNQAVLAATQHPDKIPPHASRSRQADPHRGEQSWQRIKGQKPIKHRGRTHQTGPRG